MKILYCLLLMLSLLSTARAATEEEAAATKALNEYLAAVTELDVPRAATFFHEPFFVVNAAATRLLSNRSEIEAWIAPNYKALKERNFARSEWAKLKVKSLGNGVVIASALAIRYKQDGQELQRLGVTYLMRKTVDGWKVATLTNHDPANVLDLD